MSKLLISFLITLISTQFLFAQYQTIQGILVPGRYTFGQSSSGIELQVPYDSYNVIRGYNGSQNLGALHFFDDTWENGLAENSAGAVNIDGINGVTLGPWNNPVLFAKNSDQTVGIGTVSPTAKLHIYGNTQSLLRLENNLNSDAGVAFKTNLANFKIGSGVGSASNSFSIYDLSAMQCRLFIDANGNIGVGTMNPISKFSVNGQIRATEVKVLADITVPDYVFEEDYELRTLEETQSYIQQNKHLPEIPSASEIAENGIDLGEMNMKLLKKIEELTLYQLDLLEQLKEQNSRIQKLEESNSKMQEKKHGLE